jgi:hypothetical protein
LSVSFRNKDQSTCCLIGYDLFLGSKQCNSCICKSFVAKWSNGKFIRFLSWLIRCPKLCFYYFEDWVVVYLGLQVKMVKTASRRQVQQWMCGHEQCCLDMVHSRDYMFPIVSGHGHFGRSVSRHGWRCPDMSSFK